MVVTQNDNRSRFAALNCEDSDSIFDGIIWKIITVPQTREVTPLLFRRGAGGEVLKRLKDIRLKIKRQKI